MIAFDSGKRLFYEGNSCYGHAVWPSPVLTPASFVDGDALATDLPSGLDMSWARFMFREDSFDPVSRIRRGRFYTRLDTQPNVWRVQVHPAMPGEANEVNKDGHVVRHLYTYQRIVAHAHLLQGGEKTVVMGSHGAQTRWAVVSIETVATAEDLVTLRALSTLGALPRINRDAIPERARSKVMETVEMVRNTAFRAGPESVIDRCRDAAQVALAGMLAGVDGEPPTDDLGKLAKRVESNGQVTLASAARIIARLHARAKPNEQERLNLRPIREQDGELAVQCLGFMLCDIGWAEW